jgi:hypothetical protein
MDKLPPLAKWAPKELVEKYSNFFTPNQELLNKNYPQIKEALYRLGTNIEMKACWEKLLSKEAFLPKQELVGALLVSEIYLMFIDVFIRPDEELKPQFKKREIKKIVDLVNKLIIATHKSSEALSASFFTVQTELSEEIIKHNPKKSRMIGFDVAPILSWAFISGVIDVLKLNAENKSLEPLEWDLWSHDKKSAWILSKLDRMDLTSLLRVYLEQLKEIPNTYASEYITSKRAAVTTQLFQILHKTYGDYMSDCVVSMVNAILNLELGIEDVTPYKPKEKNR